jgi:hypothetical protein
LAANWTNNHKEIVMKRFAALAGACLAMLVPVARAGSGLDEGTYFSHGDWEVACDNTHTCRAAGYQPDDEEHAVSVLLTRKAGAGQAVTGQLQLGDDGNDENPLLSRLPDPITVAMRINGAPQGSVSISKETRVGELSSRQVSALIDSLSRRSTIEFSAGTVIWHLSDAGASAVLLKMDDDQGRIGTRGALIRKGDRGEAGVTPARPAPVVHKAHVLDRELGAPAMFAAGDLARLRKALATGPDGDCEATPQADEADSLQAARLDDHHVLISMPCWRGAYNEGFGFWMVEDKAPFQPMPVTTDGSDYRDGRIEAKQRGRGPADCGSTDAWVWDGSRFVHATSFTWGLCKSIAAGGAWALPTLVSDVR